LTRQSTKVQPGAASEEGGSRPSSREHAKLWAQRHATILGPGVALVLMVGLFSILAPSTFLASANLRNILSQVAVLGVMAAGLTFVLLLAHIDLAVANVAVLSGVMASVMYVGRGITLPFVGTVTFGEGSQLVATIAALALATLLGFLAGLLTRFGLPSFIATLGILELALGLAFFWSNGEIIYDLPPVAESFGGGFWGPVPLVVIATAIILLACHLILRRTRFGRYVYMTGANREAAELSGVPTRRVIVQVFMLSGFLSGVAGLLLVGRLGSAQANAGPEFLLPAIAAVVLGGTSLFGGVGGIGHTVIGLLLYGVLNNGLDQLQINVYLKPFARGGFLLIAIVFNLVALRLARRATLKTALVEESKTDADTT
jgi:ribose transport system permease protein